MFTVTLPSATAPATQYAGQTQLVPGQTVEARVLALLADGNVRIAIADLVLDVRSQVPLEPGSTLRLAVKGAPDSVKLVPIPGSIRPPPAAAGETAVRPVGEAVVARAPLASGASAPPVAASRPEAVVKIDLAPGQPAPASQGAGEGTRARGVPPISPGADLVPTSAPAGGPKAAPAANPPAGPPAVSPEAALAGAVRTAAARQSGLAPLFANLEQLSGLPLPPPLREAMAKLLGLRLPVDRPPGGEDIKAALARSGLFLEARLASAPPGAPDLKLALNVLRHILRGVIGDADTAARPPGGPATASAPSGAPAASIEWEPGYTPPPPYRGAPTAAQPAVPPTLREAMPLREVAERLLAQTEGALARQTLLQAASLPERAEGIRHDPQAARWLFEVPLATPQGTSVAQFEISRDGEDAGAREDAQPVWRARFSVDIEPMGPVHAQVSLIGSRAAVTLWAEREATAARLRDDAAILAKAFQAEDIELGDVQFRLGAPRPPAAAQAPAGRFLDQAS